MNYNNTHQQYSATLNPFYNSTATWQNSYYCKLFQNSNNFFLKFLGGYQNYPAALNGGMRSAPGNELEQQTAGANNNPSNISNNSASHNHSTTPTSLLSNNPSNWPVIDPFNISSGGGSAVSGILAGPHPTAVADPTPHPFYSTPYPSQQYSSYNSAHS